MNKIGLEKIFFVVGMSFICIGIILNSKGEKSSLSNNKLLYDKIISQSLGSDIDNKLVYGQRMESEEGGLYLLDSTKNDDYPIYFYRGNIIYYNHVVFANHCWNVVRTTNTGGIKMIYSGKYENGSCIGENIGLSKFNDFSNDPAYVGYMYGKIGTDNYEEKHSNENESTIKKFIDKWYEENLINYTDRLEDTVWCNNRKYTKEGLNDMLTSYVGDKLRGGSVKASFDCEVNDSFTVGEKGNGKLKYPIGLLTGDEVILGGVRSEFLSKEYFRSFLNNNYFWIMTPFYDDTHSAFMSYVTIKFDKSRVDKELEVRPAISLRHDIQYTSGDGTLYNPYIIK